MSKGKSKGKAPRKVIYNNEEFVAVRRDFLVEHPRVADRQEWECDRIRTQHGIHVEQAKSEPLPKPVDVFLELPFPDNIRQELQRRFQKPTPIQVQTWTAALQGCDLVGIAETGSGKTLAYVLPMLMHVNAQEDLGPGDGPIGLVLVPTQNLCHQVAKVLQRNAQTQGSGLKVLSGDSEDMLSHDEMRQRCHILVSTTGRFQSFCRERERRSNLNYMRRCTFLVLDEADELLSQDDFKQGDIIKDMREDRQVLLFSSTWPTEVERLSQTVLKFSPLKIICGTQGAACKNVSQSFEQIHCVGDSGQAMNLKLEKLKNFLSNGSPPVKSKLNASFKILIFVNKKDIIANVVSYLRENCGISGVSGYEGEDKDAVLKRFSALDSCDVSVLVATQVLGRGLDVQTIKVVINFDMPMKVTEYIHRIGRTGRAGEKGESWSMLEKHDLAIARELSDCLKDSDVRVPGFIREACREWKKHFEYRKSWHQEQSRLRKEKEEAEAAKTRQKRIEQQDTPSTSSNSPFDYGPEFNKPFLELLNGGTNCGGYYCLLCNRNADEGHLWSERHKNYEAAYYENPASWADTLAHQRSLLPTSSQGKSPYAIQSDLPRGIVKETLSDGFARGDFVVSKMEWHAGDGHEITVGHIGIVLGPPVRHDGEDRQRVDVHFGKKGGLWPFPVTQLTKVGKFEYCQKGHLLSRTVDDGYGECNCCGKSTANGEAVMQCRACNWYLCDNCYIKTEQVKMLTVRISAGPSGGLRCYVMEYRKEFDMQDMAAKVLDLEADIRNFLASNDSSRAPTCAKDITFVSLDGGKAAKVDGNTDLRGFIELTAIANTIKASRVWNADMKRYFHHDPVTQISSWEAIDWADKKVWSEMHKLHFLYNRITGKSKWLTP